MWVVVAVPVAVVLVLIVALMAAVEHRKRLQTQQLDEAAVAANCRPLTAVRRLPTDGGAGAPRGRGASR